MTFLEIYNQMKVSCHNKKSIHYLSKYIKFIQSCDVHNNKNIYYTEKHHILPSSMWKEYKNLSTNKWNLSHLTPRQHFIAHWMLARCFGGKMWYAFHIMMYSSKNNSKRYFGFTSRTYAECRLNLKNNNPYTNRKTTSPETKRLISIANTGLVSVKDADGNFLRVNKSDQRYIDGELVHVWVGEKHSKETKKKMSEWVRSPELKRKISISAKIPCTQEKKRKISKSLKGRKIPTQAGKGNPSTKILKLISPNNIIYNILTGDFIAFCRYHNLSHGRINEFRDKGKIHKSKTNYSSKALENSYGWEAITIGYLKQLPDVKLSSIDYIYEEP